MFSKMVRLKKYGWISFVITVFLSCSYEFPVEAPFTTEDLGEISVEKVMAVGDGFMAGVMDGRCTAMASRIHWQPFLPRSLLILLKMSLCSLLLLLRTVTIFFYQTILKSGENGFFNTVILPMRILILF